MLQRRQKCRGELWRRGSDKKQRLVDLESQQQSRQQREEGGFARPETDDHHIHRWCVQKEI